MYFRQFVFVFSFMLILGACGSDGGSGTAGKTGDNTSTTPSTPIAAVKLSGIVTYTHYKAGQTGLEYNKPTERPIRGAVIELRDASGAVLKSDNTSETGAYSFMTPVNASLRVVIKAALGSPDAPRMKVVDNTSSGALYALKLDVTTETVDVVQNFNANSGWSGTTYSGVRAAAPFAILDTIYQSERLVLSVDPTVVFPELTVNWSKKNKPAVGLISVGDIGSASYYSGTRNLYLLGAENNDTDEYDSSVIAHEWNHHFQNYLSRDDGMGGRHFPGDILDPTVAFSEGFANAFAGMVFNDPLFIDTGQITQGSVLFGPNLDADLVADNQQDTTETTLSDGFYSENSVWEIFYDLFDSSASDDDALSLGFKPIYDVMVGGHRTTPAIASIFSFLHYLKTENSSVSAQITALAAAENIGSGDEFEAFDTPFYTDVPTDGSIVSLDVNGKTLQTWDRYGPITVISPGNKLFNRMAFKFSIPSSGGYSIEVTPTGTGNFFFLLNEKGKGTWAFAPGPGDKAVLLKPLITGTYSMRVGSFDGPATFTVRIFETPA